MQEKDQQVTYSYVMQSHPRGMSQTEPITNTCNRPWKTTTIDGFTNCLLCICDGWLPKPVGKITDFENLEDIWNNPIAHKIQNNVAEKKFTWCAVEHCGIKHHDNIENKYEIILGIDDSCNLQCPSCRREKRMHTSGPLFDMKLNAVQHTVNLLNKFQERIHITFNCSGDPLASYISRPFLQSYVGNDKQTFTLFTNGILIKKLLPTTAIFSRITTYRISVDAGSPETYEKVRVGGDWKTLMSSFDFLKEQGLSKMVELVFVVQKNNFEDIPNYVNMLEKYEFYGALMQLDDWGTWNRDPVVNPDAWTLKNGTYVEHNVLDSNHPLYHNCKKIVSDYQNHPRLHLTARIKHLLEL